MITGFVICDSDGNPVVFGLDEDVASCAQYALECGSTLFTDQKDAECVLNALPATSGYEGFEGGTVRRASLDVGEVVALQDESEEEDE